jgi:hypothetical protein
MIAAIGLTAIAAIMPFDVHGQYSVCDASVAQLVDRRNEELAAISEQRAEQQAKVDQQFSASLKQELVAIHRQHMARMEEVAAEQAALKGNHIEKFFPMILIRAKRDGIRRDTLKANGEAQAEWREWRFGMLASIDRESKARAKLVSETYAGAIARRRDADCP